MLFDNFFKDFDFDLVDRIVVYGDIDFDSNDHCYVLLRCIVRYLERFFNICLSNFVVKCSSLSGRSLYVCVKEVK